MSFKKGDFYIERKGIKSSTSELPFQLAVMEILNDEKYINYLKWEKINCSKINYKLLKFGMFP